MSLSPLSQPLASLGLKAMPFPKAPSPDALFRWPALEEGLARLRFALTNRGFALLTGEVGSGKSTLLRAFCHEIDPTRYPTVNLADSALSPREFYRRVLEHFGVTPGYTQSRARRQFQTLLDDLATAQQKTPLLIIDEGHELSAEMVQEIRYLQNLSYDAESPFALVLCGQPELRALLRLKAFEAVTQRVTVRFHLTGLSLPQMTAYLTHALALAGVDRPLFTGAALTLLHTHSRGLLRRAGLIATHALLDTALTKTPLVEETSVRRAISELDD